MAALRIRDTIRDTIIAALMVSALLVASSLAAEPAIDWNDEQQFNDNFENNPSAAFENNPAKAWEAIKNNPNVLTKQNVLDAAFAKDSSRAAGILNTNVNLFDKENVQNKFDGAAVGTAIILNTNPQAKAAWLEKKYKISMDDQGVEIKGYDGTKIITGGTKGTAFNIKDVPDATIQQDGSLHFREAFIGGTEEFFVAADEFGKELYHTKGGEVTLGQEAKNLRFKSDESIVRIAFAKNDFVAYEGNFVLEQGAIGQLPEVQGTKVSGTFSRSAEYIGKAGVLEKGAGFPPIEIKGTIFQEEKEEPYKFILLDKTTVIEDDKTIIDIETNSRIYYTEAFNRKDEGAYCKKNAGFGCITNRQGDALNSPYRGRLAFQNIREGDSVSVKTPAYFDRVEVLNQQGGEITFASLDNGRIVTEVKSSATTPPQFKGAMEDVKAGRFDVLYNKDPACQGETCAKLLHHWSSNKFQKDSSYFKKPRDHFATCTFGQDCEEIFAQSFGHIIPPKDPSKKISTTIIAAGDNTHTPKSMAGYCQQEGCYILNSRDVPPATKSSRLVVTGHHIEGDDNVWRDPPAAVGDHNPIDKLYFATVEGGSPLDALPPGNVEHLSFSACNTATDKDYSGFQQLRTHYGNLQNIQGWDGKAPLYEGISIFALNPEERKREAIGSKEFSKGERAWYVKQADGSWVQTNGIKEPEVIVTATGEQGRSEDIDYYENPA